MDFSTMTPHTSVLQHWRYDAANLKCSLAEQQVCFQTITGLWNSRQTTSELIMMWENCTCP